VKFFPNAETLSIADKLEKTISWNDSRGFFAMGFKYAKRQEANIEIGVEETACALVFLR
jgi:dTDP-4-dehydrorhamnose 3,5-epimerase-like enzyme